jgi:tRNA/tmRNA/rRNA uracil-C5-methylase (TrmA/RlmC/RlmD family)
LSFQPGELVELTIEGVAQGGWCVARPPGVPVVFVRHALPGERVLAKVTEVMSKFARADAVSILDASPDRVEPPCPSARPGGCGGCDWQHAALPAQRALKAAVVREQLQRLARIDREVTVEPMPVGDDREGGPGGKGGPGGEGGTGLGWRTRVQFAVDSGGTAGLRAHRSHEVVHIGDCLIAHQGIRDLAIPRRQWVGATAVEAAVGATEREVTVVSPGRPAELPDVGAESVLSQYGRKLAPVRGRPYLTQRAAGRDWRVSAGAFWQVHPAAADTLAEAVLTALEPKPGDGVLDLYCGVGLFAGVLAAAVGPDGTVTGIESDEAAVRDARGNLREFPWAKIHRGDVGTALRSALHRRLTLPAARLVVADPPRSGLDRAVVEDLSSAAAGAGSAAPRLCYVSCDPATLARDIGLLLARGWVLDGLRALDAFPMTHHVECVAMLTRQPSP